MGLVALVLILLWGGVGMLPLHSKRMKALWYALGISAAALIVLIINNNL